MSRGQELDHWQLPQVATFKKAESMLFDILIPILLILGGFGLGVAAQRYLGTYAIIHELRKSIENVERFLPKGGVAWMSARRLYDQLGDWRKAYAGRNFFTVIMLDYFNFVPEEITQADVSSALRGWVSQYSKLDPVKDKQSSQSCGQRNCNGK